MNKAFQLKQILYFRLSGEKEDRRRNISLCAHTGALFYNCVILIKADMA
jgi:hypothetical protein